MKLTAYFTIAFVSCSFFAAHMANAQDQPEKQAAAQSEEATELDEEAAAAAAMKAFMASIPWEKSAKGAVGSHAEIGIPEGYVYTASSGTIEIMKAFGNLTNGSELGYIAPSDHSWFAVFEFDSCGYVKDDDKDNLDVDEIFSQLKEGQNAANKELVKQGLPTLELVGWHTEPFYNPTTNNLEWAIRLRGDGGAETINYKTKLLGRRGVMDVVLVCDESQMAEIVPAYQKLLAGYSFHSDESYAAYTDGDKVAEYGLTGLIVGGGLLAAAKSGLLTKLWKPIALGLLVVGAFIKRLFGRKNEA